ncbi:MAG TPA: AbrB/MazE/SpoVT family DNA-binding domain-containing protein [Thermomicrobiaceae bacterium]|nr:AbrB/MazE/SpoVT family DNA-binding domain-containing protein [Thermomicrobiaceae bacterium]
MASKVGTKGQIVIAKEIRDELGIEPGWTAFQQIVDDHVEIYFLPPRHNRSLYGILADKSNIRIPMTDDAMHEATELAWTLHVFEDAFMDHYPDASDEEIDQFVNGLRVELLANPNKEDEILARTRKELGAHPVEVGR